MQHFYRNASTERTNSPDLWESQLDIQSTSVTHTSWDYRRDHAAKIKRFPKQGFCVNMPLDQG